MHQFGADELTKKARAMLLILRAKVNKYGVDAAISESRFSIVATPKTRLLQSSNQRI